MDFISENNRNRRDMFMVIDNQVNEFQNNILTTLYSNTAIKNSSTDDEVSNEK